MSDTASGCGILGVGVVYWVWYTGCGILGVGVVYWVWYTGCGCGTLGVGVTLGIVHPCRL